MLRAYSAFVSCCLLLGSTPSSFHLLLPCRMFVRSTLPCPAMLLRQVGTSSHCICSCCFMELKAQRCRGREFKAALHWLAWADRRRPDCPHLQSRIAYALLVMGDITAAAATFQVSDVCVAYSDWATEPELASADTPVSCMAHA